MRAKTKRKGDNKTSSDKDPVGDYVYRPCFPDEYPEHIVTDNYEYFRFWCLPTCVVYEKYRGQVRLSFYILPDQKDIFKFEEMVTYAESHKGYTVCKPQLR